MTDPKRIADELMVLASATNNMGLSNASLQITLAAGVVLAEAGGPQVPVPEWDMDDSEDDLAEWEHCGNVVAFRRPAS
ncbi:hypothetical protein [Tropicimonas isoalkanivorans]|uniref:Uncharacterized protein n=1 Tax=Tropicimonas isoalkanivorans TaxID=441112 RepID=A0A1I1QYZ2_9RHOB|nr:hypothetical protein [Tropicimonas isoalkanivorans]SFD27255.1 hypothetical protein SAMN04488094_12525 [Tropicimonas isoalkanivorans]